jgi:hypothetical protein
MKRFILQFNVCLGNYIEHVDSSLSAFIYRVSNVKDTTQSMAEALQIFIKGITTGRKLP